MLPFTPSSLPLRHRRSESKPLTANRFHPFKLRAGFARPAPPNLWGGPLGNFPVWLKIKLNTRRASRAIWSLRQRDELGFARHRLEPTGFPIGLGLLDALLARGDEVPPDVARTIHGGAADHRDPRGHRRRHGDAVAWLENEQAAGFEPVGGDFDL